MDIRERDTMNAMNDSEVRAKIRTILLIEDEESHAELVRRSFEENTAEWGIYHVVSI